jgi:phosphoglycolate phosphatase
LAAIVFDLDGTLIHSAPDLLAAANVMLAGAGAAALDLPTLTGFIGNGVPVLVERIIAARDLDPARHPQLLEAFHLAYAAAPADLTEPYPGVVSALTTLRAQGHALGICTNKPEAPARRILDLLGLTPFFGVVVGGDTLAEKKPDPAPLRAAFAGLGAARGLYVGDSEVDAETALAAGLPFALYTGGYRKAPPEAIAHDAAFDGFAGFPALAAGFADR